MTKQETKHILTPGLSVLIQSHVSSECLGLNSNPTTSQLSSYLISVPQFSPLKIGMMITVMEPTSQGCVYHMRQPGNQLEWFQAQSKY